MNVANSRREERRDKLFNFRPALFAAFFLIFGIVFAYYRLLFDVSLYYLLLFIPVVALTLVFSRGWKEAGKRTVVLLSLFLFFALGFIGFRSQVYSYADCAKYAGEAVVTGTVENRNKEKSKAVLRDITVNGEKVKGRLVAYLPTSFTNDLEICERVVFHGEIKTDARIIGDYGIRTSAIFQKRYYAVTVEEDAVTVGKSKNALLRIRARMEKVVYAGMDETPAAFTLALLTGDVSGIEEGLNENMRYGGISHIFAVSGLNVGALFVFCLLLFAKTPLRRMPKWGRFLLLLGILTLYSGICGFSASVSRAAVLCIVGYFLKLFGRTADLLNGLGVCAIVLLIVSPVQLFDVGFQLSFLACLGLLLLTRPIAYVFDEGCAAIRKRFPRKYSEEEEKLLMNGDMVPPSTLSIVRKWVVSLLSASLAAQITTLPALFLHFGYVSGWSLLLNFVFVPFTDGIFTFLLLLVGIACCFPVAISSVFLYLPSVVWSGAMLVFEVVDFSNFALYASQLSLGICVCYYGGVLLASDKLNVPKKIRGWLSALCFMGFLIGFFLLNF